MFDVCCISMREIALRPLQKNADQADSNVAASLSFFQCAQLSKSLAILI